MVGDEAVFDPTFEIGGGKSESFDIPVLGLDRDLTIVVKWDHFDSRLVDLRLVAPDGVCEVASDNPQLKRIDGSNYKIARLYRDARVNTIGGGATEVMLEEVAKRSLVG